MFGPWLLARGPLILLGFLLLAAHGCGSDTGSSSSGSTSCELPALEPITPPFEVRGELEGLLLLYFDAEGVHPASSREAIPEASREYVRIDSLSLAPDERLDPAQVYVADLRQPRADGSYPVRLMSRDAFEALADQLLPQPALDPQALATSEVIIYGASWCPACRAAARFFDRQGVEFVEKDIERDPAARAEMQRKAQAAGVTPRGIPVIDFRGTILPGFDEGTLERLIDESARTI
ncbi:MAG: glutaredoxin family protein [Myxococcales bacterium]|nr:glutaredoxin family protein [Myxococcales bacterium]